MTPAEERAQRENLPVVLLLPYEAIAVAQGDPMIVRLEDGGEALVRLMDAHEFLKRQHEAADKYGAERVSFARACELARPLDLPRKSELVLGRSVSCDRGCHNGNNDFDCPIHGGMQGGGLDA